MYQHYAPGGTTSQSIPRLYYTDENAKKIDAIREQIAYWQQQQLIDQAEFYLLLFSLLEAASSVDNTTGMQTSFLKYVSSNASQNCLLKVPLIAMDKQSHQVSYQDSLTLIDQLPAVDVLYVDPPYSRKQYLAAYHLLETIACWDQPKVSGIAGIRQDHLHQSSFCHPEKAFVSLKKIVSSNCYQHLLLSYSSDGLLKHEMIIDLLSQYGEVSVYPKYLPRYQCMRKSDPRYSDQAQVEERVYYLNSH